VSIQDIIAAKQRSMLPFRLIKGAAVLGRLWRENLRCLEGWAGGCLCPAPTNFCIVKNRWLALLKELHGGLPYGLDGSESYLILEAMTQRMFEATGLTMQVEVPGAKVPIRVGASGTTLKTISDLSELDGTADYGFALRSVLKIQEVLS
jgi:hypothetical protein